MPERVEMLEEAALGEADGLGHVTQADRAEAADRRLASGFRN